MDIVALFYDMDQFAIIFEPLWKRHLLSDGKHPPLRRNLPQLLYVKR